MAESFELDFAGKIVHVYMRPGTVDAYTVASYGVEDPQFVEQSGSLFLVGKTFECEEDPPWHSGATVGILWESVSCFLVFDSREHYAAAWEAIKAQAAKTANANPTKISSFWPFRRA